MRDRCAPLISIENRIRGKIEPIVNGVPPPVKRMEPCHPPKNGMSRTQIENQTAVFGDGGRSAVHTKDNLLRHFLSLAIAFCLIGATGTNAIHAQEQPANAESQLLRDMHDLMNITKAIHLFAIDHDGRLPGSLGETLPYIEDWTSWTENKKPKATPAEKARLYLSSRDTAKKPLPAQVTPDWINEHASYIYLAKPVAKLADYSDLSKTVIAHGKLDDGYAIDHKTEGEIVRYPLAMLDAHAESHPKEEIRKLLEASDRE